MGAIIMYFLFAILKVMECKVQRVMESFTNSRPIRLCFCGKTGNMYKYYSEGL